MALRGALSAEEIERILRRLEAGERPADAQVRALCAMARELLQAAPPAEVLRLAQVVVSSRGALPLDPAQAQALAAAVLKAAEGNLIESARAALAQARDALILGQNWIEGLERIRAGSRLGAQVVGLARSMTKTMHRHLRSTAEPLNLGMGGPLEALDPAEPGYKEVAEHARIPRRKCASELERAHEALRVARLGVLKVARFTHALGSSPDTRVWDDSLAEWAAKSVLDARAHLAEATAFLEAPE
jgi:hypothetical protein